MNLASGALPDDGLDGAVALVTGARDGIGLATVTTLLDHGAWVLVNGRSHERLRLVLERLRQDLGPQEDPARVAGFVADVGCPDQVAEAFSALPAAMVPTVLVNNVGVRDRRGVDDLDTPAFSALVQADLVSAYDVIRQFLQHRDRAGADGGGAIVNVSSLAATRGRAGDVGYAAAKAGIEGMTRSLATELGPRGFRVNAVAPGMVATAANASLEQDERFKQLVAERTALGRWARPEEIAEAIVFLASRKASYITGQTLMVDAGFSTLF